METRFIFKLAVTFTLITSCVKAADVSTKFLGVGYNLLTGNPDGDLLSRGGIDPGLLFTRKILDLTSKGAVQSENRRSCTQMRRTDVFYGGKSYQNKLKRGVSLGAGANAGIASFAFSLSSRFEQAREQTTNERKVFQDEQLTCNLGRVRFAEELAHAYSFRVTENFAAAVCRLPSFYDKHKYMAFLDQWGTHVTMEVELGTKCIKRQETTLTQFVEHVSELSSTDVSAGGSYMGYGASLEVNFGDFQSSSSYLTQFGSYLTTLSTGSPALPEPIGLSIQPIDQVLRSVYWQNTSLFTQHQVCMTSDLASLGSVRANMGWAVEDYAAYKKAALPSDPKLIIPVMWPRGTYGLYMPRSGCPYSSFPWHQGWLYQDTEDIGQNNVFSNTLHLYGQFRKNDNIETHFCIKGQARATEFDLDWPKGDYCIAKYGACPRGFWQGWLYWNDEDMNNSNDHNGYLPDGVYNENTKMEFCCRNDSLPTIPIALPTDSPFHLLRHSRTCQRVNGMNTVEEFVYWDEQYVFINYDIKSGGFHPFDDGNANNHKLHFCYYYPMSYSTGLIG